MTRGFWLPAVGSDEKRLEKSPKLIEIRLKLDQGKRLAERMHGEGR